MNLSRRDFLKLSGAALLSVAFTRVRPVFAEAGVSVPVLWRGSLHHQVIPIDPILDAYRRLPDFVETPGLMGNLMARTRMVVLYYHANRERRLVCGTSNRTEYLLGYTTKYGDNAGDLQPILHLFKTEVRDLARDLGIPETIIRKTPSAGLWEGQSDEGPRSVSPIL